MRNFWEAIYPGIFVTILGVEALMLAVWPDEIAKAKKRIKIIAVVLASVLATSEILVLRRDRQETLDQHTRDMEGLFGRFSNLDQTTAALLQNERTSRRMPADGDILKKQVLDLSNDMLQFLISREVPPGWGQGRYGEGPYGGKPTDTEAYDKETLDTYLRAFEPRVATIYETLRKRGLRDEQLSSEYSNPVNIYSVRNIAERLTSLAEKLPD